MLGRHGSTQLLLRYSVGFLLAKLKNNLDQGWRGG
jgi:hypothetical protein